LHWRTCYDVRSKPAQWRCSAPVRISGWIGGDRPAGVAEQARRRSEGGLTAIKMTGSAEFSPIDTPRQVDLIVKRVAALREAIGRDL
jgi:galactonate dehydratase